MASIKLTLKLASLVLSLTKDGRFASTWTKSTPRKSSVGHTSFHHIKREKLTLFTVFWSIMNCSWPLCKKQQCNRREAATFS